jgi:hypothetical protein
MVVIGWGEGKLFAQNAETRSTYQCLGLYQQRYGLMVSGCGSMGDIDMRARPADQIGHVCGIIGGPYPSFSIGYNLTDADVENCFWQAYITCRRPATLLFDQRIYTAPTATSSDDGYNPPAKVEDSYYHTLVVQYVDGTCSLTDHATNYNGPTPTSAYYTCASLARDANGYLTAHRCGAEGDVVISPPSQSATPSATP